MEGLQCPIPSVTGKPPSEMSSLSVSHQLATANCQGQALQDSSYLRLVVTCPATDQPRNPSLGLPTGFSCREGRGGGTAWQQIPGPESSMRWALRGSYMVW